MIYMDNAATTAVRKEVAEAMLPYLLGDYGNPSGVYRLSEKAKNMIALFMQGSFFYFIFFNNTILTVFNY